MNKILLFLCCCFTQQHNQEYELKQSELTEQALAEYNSNPSGRPGYEDL